MSLTVQVEGFDDLVHDVHQMGTEGAKTLMKAAITNSVNKIQSNARELAPHRTGALQRSIQTQVDYPVGTVSVEEKYGQWIESGTGIYGPTGQRIQPKSAKVLAWQGATGMMFARSIKGMKPRPFFKPGVEKSADYISQQFTTVLRKITEGMAGK